MNLSIEPTSTSRLSPLLATEFLGATRLTTCLPSFRCIIHSDSDVRQRKGNFCRPIRLQRRKGCAPGKRKRMDKVCPSSVVRMEQNCSGIRFPRRFHLGHRKYTVCEVPCKSSNQHRAGPRPHPGRGCGMLCVLELRVPTDIASWSREVGVLARGPTT